MMEKMIFGRYVPADSTVHKMDPRSKLVIIFLFVCIIFLANNLVTYALIGIYTFYMLGISRIPARFLYGGLKPAIWLVLFTLILQVFLQSRVYYSLNLDQSRYMIKGLDRGFLFR